MPFLCPQCTSPGALDIKLKIELPPDSRSDEIMLQVVECSRCDFAGIAVYEESRRGALDSESFDHTGFRVTADDRKELKKTIRSCPAPTNWRCQCPSHRLLGRQDASGRWNALAEIHTEGRFELKR
jgi:hypothetical protein